MTTDSASKPDSLRQKNLAAMLSRERNNALMKVRAYRHDQDDEALPAPADELDAARSLAEIETHASLIEQAEDRLRQIDDAFNRLERGLYGLCKDCGAEIPAARLEVLPFATRCVDCQETRNHTHRGKGALQRPYDQVWEVPPEMAENTDTMSRGGVDRAPEEKLTVRGERPLGREEAELEQPPKSRPRVARRGS